MARMLLTRSLMRKELKLWLISVILLSPVIILYLSHYLIRDAQLLPTGFIQSDMPYYMANAREHFDANEFHLFYGNPFSSSYNTPRIYFQPQTLLLGIIWRLSGIDPGVVFVLFGCFASVLFIRVGLALYKEICGFESWERKLGVFAFFWGGGFIALMGVFYTFMKGGGIKAALYNTGLFELETGWWFFNLGRNLVYPTEAYYHVLFLACVLLLIRNQYIGALVLAFVTSISHPFTGVELLLILFTWSIFEIFFIQNSNLPRYFLFVSLGLLTFHIGYYLFFLRLFSEHRALLIQWMGGETLGLIHWITAYGAVGLLSLWTVRHLSLAKEFFGLSRNRFLLVWFIVAFILANHQILYANSIQPLHFTRGYVWTPLFLMGVSSFISLLSFIISRLSRVTCKMCICIIIVVFCLDNIIWFSRFPFRAIFRDEHQGFYLTSDQIQVFEWMKREENRGSVILSQDKQIGYLATVYTPLRSWRSHGPNTPESEKRKRELEDLFNQGIIIDVWKKIPLLIVCNKILIVRNNLAFMYDGNYGKAFENASYVVFKHSISATR